jgi:hypothetical protein
MEFLYTDSIDPLTAPEVAHDMLVAANKFSLARLARLAEGRLVRYLDPENAASMMDLADSHCRQELRAAAVTMSMRRYSEVCSTEAYADLPRRLKDELRDMWLTRQHAYRMDVMDEEARLALEKDT